MNLSTEAKVGAFVMTGLAVLIASVLMLGDVSFQSQYRIYVQFNTVEGLAEKGAVKVFGVPIGKIEKVELQDQGARVTLLINKKNKLPGTSSARIGSTGLIGSKYLEILPNPDKLADKFVQRSGFLEDGDTIKGQDVADIMAMMEKIGKAFDQITGDGKFAGDLKATMANLRHTSEALSSSIGDQKEAMTSTVKNVEALSERANNFMKNLDEIVTKNKENIDIALQKLKETLENASAVLARLNKGEGAIGALMTDKKVESDVKETVTNLRQTSDSAKEVLARFTKVRSWWDVGMRYDVGAGSAKGDFSVRLSPRPGKYYVLGGSNLGSGTESKDAGDYERRNTINALLGREYEAFDIEAGAIRSSPGLAIYYRPFHETPKGRKFELLAKGFDFSRDYVVKLRRFRGPNYIAGARYHINSRVNVGVQVEDILQTASAHATVNASFEDRDFAYLLGFVSFAR